MLRFIVGMIFGAFLYAAATDPNKIKSTTNKSVDVIHNSYEAGVKTATDPASAVPVITTPEKPITPEAAPVMDSNH